MSLWPAPRHCSERPDPELNLMVSNGQPIPAFRVHTRKINIDGFDYISPFISAKVSRPILGIDFFKKHKMCLDLSKNLLSHSGVQTVFEHATLQSNKIHLVHGTMQCILRVLDRFPQVTNPGRASVNKMHEVKCFIKTKGPPIKSNIEFWTNY